MGLVFDLGGPREVDSVRIRLGGSPTDLSIYIASPDQEKVPRSLKALRRVAILDGAGVDAFMSLESGEVTRYVVVWLRKLPEVDTGTFRGEIREVVIRGRT